MAKELKELIEKSRQGMKEIEEKVEEIGEEFSGEVAEFWSDAKKYMHKISGGLETSSQKLEQGSDEAKLQAHLGMMEAKDKVEGLKGGFDEFVQKAVSDAKTEMDTAVVRAHLAKKEAEDFWEEKGKTITRNLGEKTSEIEKLAGEAIADVKSYFDTLSTFFSKKA